MKREYSRPTIQVEVISLDMPIAAACQAHYESPELQAQGWFVGDACVFDFDNTKGDDRFLQGVGDTVCYHSHAKTTFAS